MILLLPPVMDSMEVASILTTLYREKNACSGKTGYRYQEIVCNIAVVELLFGTGIQVYTIWYLQFEGEGTLTMDNGITFLPNDHYLLENEKFRLYYKPKSDEAHNFIVVVEDNFDNSYELEFDFNNRIGKDDQTVIPIGNFKPLP